MSQKVMIRLTSTVTDLVLAEAYQNGAEDGYFVTDEGVRLPISEINRSCEDVVSYEAIGEMYLEDGRRIIRYREHPEIGYTCHTTLILPPDRQDSLLMARSGEMSTAILFDERDKRQHCSYETPIIPLEFSIITRHAKHRVDERGGAVLIDYIMEIGGVAAQRLRLFIEVCPLSLPGAGEMKS